MSTRGTFRRRGARVDAIEDGVDKGELLARAREATRATYGAEEEARGARSSAAGTWDALRGGVAKRVPRGRARHPQQSGN